MIFLTAMIIWGAFSLFFMISSVTLGFFQTWYVFVYLGVYFLMIVWGLLDAIKKDSKVLKKGTEY